MPAHWNISCPPETIHAVEPKITIDHVCRDEGWGRLPCCGILQAPGFCLCPDDPLFREGDRGRKGRVFELFQLEIFNLNRLESHKAPIRQVDPAQAAKVETQSFC